MGCVIGGSTHPAVAKARNALSPFFGYGWCTLYGHGGASRADAQHAALLNGIASHVHDYDDTHLATITHPAGPVASALLAIIEHLAHTKEPGLTTGEEMLTALVAGIETSCLLGLSVWPSHYDIGWHITSTTGSLGAAAAVGRILRLSTEQMQHALGIAASQVTGLRCMFGSDTKSFHPGRAAQAGLVAALLAQQGYTASEDSLEAKRGWANVVVGGGQPQLDKHLAQLGTSWEVKKNAFKPFPCGIVCHPVIDGCIKLHERLLEQANVNKHQDVDLTKLQIRAKVHPLVIELTSKRKPRDGLEAKFSVYHGAAVALLYGKATPAEYADDVVQDATVIAIRDAIHVEADADMRAEQMSLTYVCPFERRTCTLVVEHALGSLETPMTREQLTRKFVDQAAHVLGKPRAEDASRRMWNIAAAKDVTDVVRWI